MAEEALSSIDENNAFRRTLPDINNFGKVKAWMLPMAPSKNFCCFLTYKSFFYIFLNFKKIKKFFRFLVNYFYCLIFLQVYYLHQLSRKSLLLKMKIYYLIIIYNKNNTYIIVIIQKKCCEKLLISQLGQLLEGNFFIRFYLKKIRFLRIKLFYCILKVI